MISLPLFVVVSLVLLAVGMAAGYYIFRAQQTDERAADREGKPPLSGPSEASV